MASPTIGMDLGDKTSRYRALDYQGKIVQEGGVATTKKALAQKFGALRRCRMAVEVATHSPWASRLLKKPGHEVIVANARQVKLISDHRGVAQLRSEEISMSDIPTDPEPKQGNSTPSSTHRAMASLAKLSSSPRRAAAYSFTPGD